MASKQPLEIKGVLRDTTHIYRSLFRRSFLTGFIVFAVLGLVEVLGPHVDGAQLRVVGVLLAMFGFVGTTFVQGALVPAVDSEHKGEAVPDVTELYRSSWSRLGSLLDLSLRCGVAIGLACFALIVPAVLLAIRWSLAPPIVMLEGLGARAAMRRSRELVRGHRGAVFRVLANVWARAGIAWFVLDRVILKLSTVSGHPLFAFWLGGALAAALVTPYAGHALSVVYYRLTDPDRPVIATSRAWHSVWREHDAAKP